MNVGELAGLARALRWLVCSLASAMAKASREKAIVTDDERFQPALQGPA